MDATSLTKSVAVNQNNSMIHGLSVLSIVEDNMNTMLMRSMLGRLKLARTDNNDPDENQEPLCPSNGSTSFNTSPILTIQNVNHELTTGTDSHSRSIIKKQRTSRKQHKSKRKMRVGTTKVMFKRKICKEPSPALVELRKALVMETLNSDTDTSSENEENAEPLQRPVYHQALLNFINDCDDKENIDLEDFQAKLKL
ncbi:uncharacterized protein LOC100679785 isoform X1 [Nasonia vitripennis]|uniref:Uncharacterized protein n=1 Tax=Nasonia vitripennis TaxID=7425 RepID=A0A7M7GD35_NASVI|nr:uncharacterized protein LOC100679785 isoform X1 [Nasonia vitripennis]